MDRIIKHWNWLPMQVVESSSLELFKKHLCVGHGIWSHGLMVNMVVVWGWWSKIMNLKVFSNVNNSMITWNLLRQDSPHVFANWNLV